MLRIDDIHATGVISYDGSIFVKQAPWQRHKVRFSFPPQSDGSLLTGGKARNIDAPRQNPRWHR